MQEKKQNADVQKCASNCSQWPIIALMFNFRIQTSCKNRCNRFSLNSFDNVKNKPVLLNLIYLSD